MAARQRCTGAGRVRWRRALAALLVAALAACGDGGGDDARAGGRAGVAEPELREELLAMQADDQAERTGGRSSSSDRDRTARLAEIVDEHGWPTRSLVGDDGASAAWLVAQHSDHDVGFQQEALELMRAAVDDGEADATELAYLEDRVALNSGRAQVYGTQVGCVDGRAVAAELEDPEGVDRRRAEVGLPPLEVYLADLADDCAAEAATTAGG
jgi:hypothetical protein